jgi:hypothetical protein
MQHTKFFTSSRLKKSISTVDAITAYVELQEYHQFGMATDPYLKETNLITLNNVIIPPAHYTNKNKFRGFSPQSELYRPSDRRLSAKLVPTLEDRGCRVVSAANTHGR